MQPSERNQLIECLQRAQDACLEARDSGNYDLIHRIEREISYQRAMVLEESRIDAENQNQTPSEVRG